MKIVIGTGGSGGHIFPALSVAAKLKEGGNEVFFIGAFGFLKEKIEEEGYWSEELEAKGLTTNSVKSIVFSIISMLESTIHVMKTLKRLRPDAVVGFGGYGAFPVILAAGLSRQRTVIHEQNVIPGRANTVLAKFVNRIALSFEKSRKFFPDDKTVLTGCPSRIPGQPYDKEQILRDFGLQLGKNTFLICGGSQGSQKINKIFLETLPSLSDFNLQVIHISGEKDYEELKNKYSAAAIEHCVVPFLDEMDKAYAVADMAIARAGAVTVTEVARFGVPTIFIPYPFAGGHQKENALILTEIHAATMIEERDLTPKLLKDTINDFWRDKMSRAEIQQHAQCICPSDAADLLAREIVALVSK